MTATRRRRKRAPVGGQMRAGRWHLLPRAGLCGFGGFVRESVGSASAMANRGDTRARGDPRHDHHRSPDRGLHARLRADLHAPASLLRATEAGGRPVAGPGRDGGAVPTRLAGPHQPVRMASSPPTMHPPSRVPLVELEWERFEEESGEIVATRRVWAPTIRRRCRRWWRTAAPASRSRGSSRPRAAREEARPGE